MRGCGWMEEPSDRSRNICVMCAVGVGGDTGVITGNVKMASKEVLLPPSRTIGIGSNSTLVVLRVVADRNADRVALRFEFGGSLGGVGLTGNLAKGSLAIKGVGDAKSVYFWLWSGP